MTFGGLFRDGGARRRPAAPARRRADAGPAPRRGLGGDRRAARRACGPLRALRRAPGFPVALERLLDELQGAGLEPADVEAAAGTLEGSAYLGDVAALFAGYAAGARPPRPGRRARRRPRGDRGCCAEPAPILAERPVFLYGLDDLTRNQLDLIGALAAVDRGDRRAALRGGQHGARGTAPRCSRACEEIGVDSAETAGGPRQHTDAPLLFHLERGFGAVEPERMPPDDSLVLLRSAGERGEAEAIARGGGAAARRRRPTRRRSRSSSATRRGAARCSPPSSSPTASRSRSRRRSPAAATVGRRLARSRCWRRCSGTGRAADLLRYLRGPSGVPPGRVDWFERAIRRSRVAETAGAALRALGGAVRRAAGRRGPGAGGGRPSPEALAAAVGDDGDGDGRARRAPSWRRGPPARSPPRWPSAPSSTASRRVPTRSPGRSPAIAVRVWSGPVEGRVRIADPYRLRAARFDHVFVASLQDGEFPRRRRPAPTPSSPRASASRSACSRGATPRPRSATSSTPAWRCRAAGSSSPTATATRTAPPRHARRSSTTSAACSSRRRGARARPGRGPGPRPRPRPGRPPGRRGAVGDRAGAGDRRPRPRRRHGRPARRRRGVEGEVAERIGARLDAARAPRPPAGRRGRSPTRP